MRKGGFVVFVIASTVVAGAGASAGCSSSNSIKASQDGGTTSGLACGSAPTVENTSLMQCPATCSNAAACQNSEPLSACCTWVAPPRDALAVGSGLHRYSAPSASTPPNLGCLATAPARGTPMTGITLTGYVWLFANGVDSQGVKVEIFEENHPDTPDGSIAATPVGSYTTSTMDEADPTDTTWNSKCPNGCQYRKYTITGIQTETPYVIRTSDAGSNGWATLYDYNVYFPSSAVQNGQVTYDATAVAGPDLATVAGTVGQSITPGLGLLAGEVHDCSDVRLFGATVETDQKHQGPMFYFTEDEGDPLPSLQAGDTSHLGLFGALNMQPGQPIRVTAVGKDPASEGQFSMLGTYVVQVYPGAVTAIALRGRRPWQP